MDKIALNSFLKFGWFINYSNSRIDFDKLKADKSKYKGFNTQELCKIGVSKLKKAIVSRFDSRKENVVPISGGLDSRAILAGLLECTEGKNIHTYTFGTPGSWDYDIGCQIANKLGTRHRTFPLTEHKYHLDDLLDVSRRVDHQTLLFHHPPIRKLEEFYENYQLWSGFMGDPLAGSHLGTKAYSDLDEAKKNFIKENLFVRSVKMDYLSNREYFPYIKLFTPQKGDISIKEQLDFNNRQRKYIAPHVLMKGFNYVLPFLDDDWATFLLSIDNELRYKQKLHKQILLQAFPKVFNYPTKTTAGLPLDTNDLFIFISKASNRLKQTLFKGSINKNINYINFNEGIRRRKDLNSVIKDSIMDLKNRKLIDWIDIEKIYKRHMDKQGNYYDALLVLSSLEINLKAKGK